MSKYFSRRRKKAISLRVFWKISVWSSDGQRRKFGAQTMAMFSTPILVASMFSGVMNVCVYAQCVYIVCINGVLMD